MTGYAAGSGGSGSRSMGMDCGMCRTCGKAFGRLVASGTKRTRKAGAQAATRYCSDKCRADARAPGKRSDRTGTRRTAPARPKPASAPHPSNAELRRQLRAESAEHRRRVYADPRMIIHCHWCMEGATTRLLDPAWRRVGARRRVVLLCARCARHAKAFMRERGYETIRTTNEDAAAIMEQVAAMKKDRIATKGRRRPARKKRGVR